MCRVNHECPCRRAQAPALRARQEHGAVGRIVLPERCRTFGRPNGIAFLAAWARVAAHPKHHGPIGGGKTSKEEA